MERKSICGRQLERQYRQEDFCFLVGKFTLKLQRCIFSLVFPYKNMVKKIKTKLFTQTTDFSLSNSNTENFDSVKTASSPVGVLQFTEQPCVRRVGRIELRLPLLSDRLFLSPEPQSQHERASGCPSWRRSCTVTRRPSSLATAPGPSRP